MLNKPLNLLAVVSLAQLVFARSSFAYLDPGTGSYVLQILAAAIFGSLFVIKSYWNKIKNFFSRNGTNSADDERQS